jgi:glycosyltransferase involved in cell wall biosynthesis
MTVRTADRLLIALDNGNLTAGESGGIFQATQALIKALGQLDGPEHFLLLADSEKQVEWLEKCAGDNQEIVVRGRRRTSGGRVRYHAVDSSGATVDRIKAAVRPAVHRLRQFIGRFTPQTPRIPMSDGFVESLGCDVLHFPTQAYAVSAVPTVFNPHDLQHLHYPQFWTPWEVARRDLVYRTGCALSAAIVVGSQWSKDDVTRQFGVHPEKVQVIPEGAPGGLKTTPSSEQVEDVKRRHRLPDKYALYPANMWPHKNHVRLLEAIALLRDKADLIVSLVCTGSKNGGAWPRIESTIARLRLEQQVRCPGYVSDSDIRAIQSAAHCLVQPSFFEASSLPMFDAWMDGVPVAAAAATALPEQAGDAALLCDPFDVRSIAEVLEKVWTRTDVRDALKERGRQRVKDFDWVRTAKAYRAVYRRVARAGLTEEDRELLRWNWMIDPQASCLSTTA